MISASSVRGRGRAAVVLALLALASCRQGTGSDIGPILERRPTEDWRVLVRDDQGRAVSGATIAVEGIAKRAVTGRSGRAQVLGRPSGRRTITIDATNGSASDSDRLGTLSLTAETGGSDELPFVVFVPDLAASTGLLLPTGVQGAASTLDDTASSGAKVTIDFGATVASGAASTVSIRTGKLSVGHHPPLPSPALGALLCAGAIAVDPPNLTISPAATLSVQNDLRVTPGNSADVYYLDPTNGSWTALGIATPTDGGARLTATGVVTRGGLYAFSTTVGTTTTIDGRVVDFRGAARGGVLVSVGEARSRTGNDGTFVLENVGSTWADGSPRTLGFEAYGGRTLRSARRADSIVLVPGTLSLGDRVLDAPRVGTVRMLQVSRGDRDPGRRMRVSSVYGLSYGISIGDDRGEVTFEEQEIGENSTNTSWILDDNNYHLTEATNELQGRDNDLELRLFTREQPYWQGRPRGTAVYPLDKFGSGFIGLAQVSRGQAPGQGFVDSTRISRPVTVDFGEFGEVLVSMETASEGRSVVCASAFVDPDSGRSEMPLERALREPIGAFDRHGRVIGSLVGGGGPGTTTKVRATRRLCLDDWFDATWYGRATTGAVPRKLDPEVSGGATFDIGVPAPKGNLVALSGTTSAGIFRLDKLGWEQNLVPVEGNVIARDVALTSRCDTSYTLPAALRNVHAALAASDFTIDLGAELVDGTILDLARAVGGNHVASGEDLVFTLPSLAAAGASRWLVTLEASKPVGSKTISQRTFVPVRGTTAPTVTLLGVPDITSPTPGALVPATGFTVSYTVPTGTSYVEVELRSEVTGETRVWHAVVHPSYGSYTFRELSRECAQPLTAGRNWTLTVTAARIETGPFTRQEEIYNRCTTSWIGLGEATREVNALSSTTIPVTTF